MAKSKLKSNAEKVPRKEKDELRICFRVRFFICGGAKGTRTPGLCVANASLYQLSYNPTRLRCVKPFVS